MIGYALTIFLSAFLLFQVQPLAGKYILPWFGGTPSVWTTCMLTFQVLLLVGYAYAHGLATWIKPRRQGTVHLAFLAVSLWFLPIIPDESWKPMGNELPTWRILCLLAATIGPPYLLLSTTGPLLQSWFARSYPGRSPYRLYALSNVGSLAALVSYPFLFEPMMRLATQAWTWSIGYMVFALLCAGLAVRLAWVRPKAGDVAAEQLDTSHAQEEITPPSRLDAILWLAFSTCGSVLLLATTNQMCQEVAVVPFLWVLPLALYLLTFIICFDREKWYQRAVYGPLLVVAVVGATAVMWVGPDVPFWVQIVVYPGSMFVCCMVCHGEMVRRKPHPRYLTRFYLTVAAGGALGGALVSLVAPVIFSGYLEYPLGLAACCVLFLAGLYADPTSAIGRRRTARMKTIMIVGSVASGMALGIYLFTFGLAALKQSRNFYGVLQVWEGRNTEADYDFRSLYHGRILHGFQFLDEGKTEWPTSYYGLESGAGLAVRFHPRRGGDETHPKPLQIGVIGLGAGTMAAHGKPGDRIRFYEINQDVIQFSKEYFTFLADSRARGADVDVVLGDARISLERALAEGRPEEFDVLVVDAFSSDSIPVHLLTHECCEIYWKHLKPDGILAIHISNRFLDLGPIVRGLANEFGHKNVMVDSKSEDDDPHGVDSATWVLVTSNDAFLESDPVRKARDAWPDNAPAPIVWTDDFSNLFQVLRW
ncbi:MAG: fused MFS/spermidine synthase [Pirellulales bacterium]|nr:fused MFS/spermidine synthase [Pirellulales bacterium]